MDSEDRGGATANAEDSDGEVSVDNSVVNQEDNAAIANDSPKDSDDEVEVTFSLPYEEVSGKKKNSKGFFYTPNNHL